MIDRLIEFLSGRKAPALEASTDDLQLSVAALLIEAAHMDSNFDDTERATIERLLAKKFDLDHEAVQSLIQQAQQKVQESAQYFPFTHQITKRTKMVSPIKGHRHPASRFTLLPETCPGLQLKPRSLSHPVRI